MTLPELGKAVSGTVDAMRHNPSCLAAIILAGIFAFLTFLAFQREAERQNQRMQAAIAIIERCYPDHQEGSRE